MRYIIPALAAVVIADGWREFGCASGIWLISASAALGGTITYSGGATLDNLVSSTLMTPC